MFTAGRSLEFVATITGQQFQHIGFDVNFGGVRFALFSVLSDGQLWARSKPTGGSEAQTALGTSFFGAPHRYRIQWDATSVSYFIDGSPVAAHAVAIVDAMRPMISDIDAGSGAGPAGALTIDWMRMTPQAASGTFISRGVRRRLAHQLDQHLPGRARFPAGASLIVNARTGNTSPPDASWTPFTPIASGADPGSSRYIQYQAVMTPTPDLAQSPVLESVSIGFPAGQPANTAPVAANDSYSVNEDTSLNVAAPGVIGNDSDANGDPLAAVLDDETLACARHVHVECGRLVRLHAGGELQRHRRHSPTR